MSVAVGSAAVDELEQRTGMSHAHMMAFVRFVGAGIIGISVVVLVLNEVFTLDAMSSEGPFSSVTDSLTSTGAAAIGLLVIGLLVAAARGVMMFFGGTF